MFVSMIGVDRHYISYSFHSSKLISFTKQWFLIIDCYNGMGVRRVPKKVHVLFEWSKLKRNSEDMKKKIIFPQEENVGKCSHVFRPSLSFTFEC